MATKEENYHNYNMSSCIISNLKSILPDYACKKMYYVLFGCVILITCYWLFLHTSYDNASQYDLMNRKLFNIDVLGNCCSGWAVSHYVFFFIIGWFFPDCGKDAMWMGALWECIEMLLSGATRIPRQAMKLNNGTYEYSDFWQASSKDIIINAMGFYSAKIIKDYYVNEQKKKMK